MRGDGMEGAITGEEGMVQCATDSEGERLKKPDVQFDRGGKRDIPGVDVDVEAARALVIGG